MSLCLVKEGNERKDDKDADIHFCSFSHAKVTWEFRRESTLSDESGCFCCQSDDCPFGVILFMDVFPLLTSCSSNLST